MLPEEQSSAVSVGQGAIVADGDCVMEDGLVEEPGIFVLANVVTAIDDTGVVDIGFVDIAAELTMLELPDIEVDVELDWPTIDELDAGVTLEEIPGDVLLDEPGVGDEGKTMLDTSGDGEGKLDEEAVSRLGDATEGTTELAEPTVVEVSPGTEEDVAPGVVLTIIVVDKMPQRPYRGSQPSPQYSVVLPHAPYWLQQSPKLRPHTVPPFSGPQKPLLVINPVGVACVEELVADGNVELALDAGSVEIGNVEDVVVASAIEVAVLKSVSTVVVAYVEYSTAVGGLGTGTAATTSADCTTPVTLLNSVQL